jgi:hypothetical protein
MTPDDDLVRIGVGPGLFDECDNVKISVAFTWDLPLAESLFKQWSFVSPTEIGGPALMTRGESFEPGEFVKQGFTITSRGCPNKCWFCSVWRREGAGIRELEIHDGYDVLDDNLLACSDDHVRRVFDMLAKQKQRPKFTGGLEAKILKPWHCERLKALKPERLYFAYDTPDDYEPLVEAGKMLRASGFTTASHTLSSYVLCGYPRDTFDGAEIRMRQTIAAGFTPMAMLYMDSEGCRDDDWRAWARRWARPSIVYSSARKINQKNLHFAIDTISRDVVR